MLPSMQIVLLCVLWVLTAQEAYCWDTAQLEVFDAVEEVNANFYETFGIQPDADSTAIKQAFRSLSRVLHPDKNDAPDADVQFRNIVSIYEVLKDPVKRQYYDEVLVNGLPNWRSAVYYFRRVRKMGMLELTTILVLFVTTGQYLIAWASYTEKKYFETQRIKKKLRSKSAVPDILIETPSIKNLLPFQIPKISVSIVMWTIWAVREGFFSASEKLSELMTKKEPEPEAPPPPQPTVKKKKIKFIPPERTDEVPIIKPIHNAKGSEEEIPPKPVSGGLWTDDDLSELVTLANKYPGGTPQRWEKIASIMNRSVFEVTFVAARLKEKLSKAAEEEVEPQAVEQPKKVKTKGGKLGAETTDQSSSAWSQEQQKALENALIKYTKGPADRWDKIANCVPGKTKEECMRRYKQLAEAIKGKREVPVESPS